MVNKTKNVSDLLAIFSIILFTVPAQAASITIPGGQVPSLGTSPSSSDFGNFFSNVKVICTAAGGICAITALIFFILSIAKLGISAGNDIQRAKALKGILYAGIALTLLGGITVVAGIFWNLI